LPIFLDFSFSLPLEAMENFDIQFSVCSMPIWKQFKLVKNLSIVCSADHHWHLHSHVYATRTFSSLPPYRMLLPAFVMCLKEISVAKRKILCLYVL
jgi:hypothetical protein